MTFSVWPALRLSISSFAPVLLVAVLASACASDASNGGSRASVRAVTSLEIFADMVRNVGGDRVDVDALLPSGADPHTYELSPQRVADVARADIVFVNGLGLEESIHDVIENNAGGPVLELTEGLPLLEETGDKDDGHEGNPHAWLDARLAARYVEHIRDGLIGIDPEGAAEYEANAAAYLEELGALDREIEEAVQSIPEQNRKLVTFHDAFPYLASRYGLEIIAVVLESPGQEPNARDVARLTETLRAAGVPAVFREPQFNAEILEQAADEAGVRVLELLSDAYTDGVDSYIDLMRYNMEQLLEGLGGE
jgi:zinc/manganese transport system substrate-binding protein/manganese/iron transport system substrate-binding protein